MKKQIDGRKLPCPQPLLLVKKTSEEKDADIIEITVDNTAAKENIVKYAKHAGLPISDIKENGNEIVMTIGAAPEASPEEGEAAPPPECLTESEISIPPRSGKDDTIFIRSDAIGPANRELGTLLMRGFIYTLTELEKKPKVMIFMNDGVRLAVEGSDSVQNLKSLIDSGTEVLVCGTCLDYLKLTEQLAAGTISNMYEITSRLMEASGVITV